MAYFICVALAIFFVLAGYLMEMGNLALLVQPAEIVMTSFPALFLGIAATSARAFRQSWGLVFGHPSKVDTREVRQVCRFLRVCGTTSMIMGGAATILGFVITMSFMAAPIEVLGEKFGACAVGLLLGLFFKTLSYVAEQRVRGRYLLTEGGKQGG